ncbi:hypothetical protein [Teredinibacter turnerae]|uniref:hypothetical protein n=1 Tax=Teredinibacter turnerae TaxID=2426 RepID=UPI00037A8689|nr:hypothetical protein [Teredinibacter turnerae]
MINLYGWQPTIGDPTFLGWFTVLAYFFAFVLSLRVAYCGQRCFLSDRQKQVWLWGGMGCLMLILAINKQLDLQSFFTAWAKYNARENGWYDHRRSIQMGFIVAVIATGFCVLSFLLVQFRKQLKNNSLALAGLCFLVSFIVIRAASFHHFDRLIGVHLGVLRINHLFELGGIGMICANAMTLLRRVR